jgi:hypothetical protein
MEMVVSLLLDDDDDTLSGHAAALDRLIAG